MVANELIFQDLFISENQRLLVFWLPAIFCVFLCLFLAMFVLERPMRNLSALGVFLLLLAGGLRVGHAAADRPNILFIMSDDHGYQAVSAYGGRLNRTPNI